MNIRICLIATVCSALLIVTTGCKEKKKDSEPVVSNTTTTTTAVETQTKQDDTQKKASEQGIVCVYEKHYIKDKPSKDGKSFTSISRGETIQDLGESVTDNSEKKPVVYYKIRLSDGKEGWASAPGIRVNATAAVFTVAASVYSRPDPLTITDVKKQPMNFVAITERNDDWAKVSWTEGYTPKEGWVKGNALTTSKEEVATAILITRKLDAKDNIPVIDKMKSLITDAPYPGSIFIEELKKKVETQETDAANAAAVTSSATDESSDAATNQQSADTVQN
jgi:hypothetical protein